MDGDSRVDITDATLAQLLSAIAHGEPIVVDAAADEPPRVASRAALQSAVLERFALHVLVEPADNPAWFKLRDAGSRSLVSLIRVDEITPGARAALQAHVSRQPPRHAYFLPEVKGDPVAFARAALVKHDYTTARAALHPIVATRRDALHLELDILVNYLGWHGEAMAVPAATRVVHEDPKVRHYLALASAHVGDLDRAETLSRGLERELVPDVAIARARCAMRSSAPEAAVRALADLEEARPNHPELSRLRSRFVVVRATAVEDILVRLQQALDHDHIERIVEESRQLRRWVAEHELLDAADQCLRDARSAPALKQLLEEAMLAKAMREFDVVDALLARVPPDLRDTSAWAPLFTWYKDAHRAREDERLLDGMRRHEVDAVRAALELPHSERRLLGEEAGLILLMYTPNVPEGRAGRQRFAEAAVALATAPPVDDPLAMWDHLEPHVPSLRRSGHVADFLDHLNDRRRTKIDGIAQQWRSQRTGVHERQELAALVSEAALLHPSVQLSIADDVAELHRLLRTRATWFRHLDRVRAALKTGSGWRAAIAATTMGHHPAPMDVSSPWPTVRAQLERVRATVPLETLAASLRFTSSHRLQVQLRWSRDHRYRYVATEQGPLLVLTREDHQEGTAVVVAMPMPEGERLIHARLDRNRWWLFTDATAIEIHPRNLALVSATRHAVATSDVGVVESVTPFGEQSWMLQGSGGYGVWSPDRPGSPIHLPPAVFFAVGGPVRGTGMVGTTGDNRSIVLSAEADGPLRPLGTMPCEAVAAHPDGGLLAFLADDEQGTGWLHEVREDRASCIAELEPPPGGLDVMVVEATTRSLMIGAAGTLHIYTVAPNGSLEPTSQVRVPPGTTLETDELGGRVQAVTTDGLRWRPAHASTPTSSASLHLPTWTHFPLMLPTDDLGSMLIAQGAYSDAADWVEEQLTSCPRAMLFERTQQLVAALCLGRELESAQAVAALPARWTGQDAAAMRTLRRWVDAIAGELAPSEPESMWLELSREAWQAHHNGDAAAVIACIDRLERHHPLDAATRALRACAWLTHEATTEVDTVRRLAALGEAAGPMVLGARVPDPELGLTYEMMCTLADRASTTIALR